MIVAMAVDTTSARNAALRGSTEPTGNRGRPRMVVIRKTTLVNGLLEGLALSMDAMSAAEQIQTAAATGNRSLVTHLAGRLGYRATRANAELRELIQAAEE